MNILREEKYGVSSTSLIPARTLSTLRWKLEAVGFRRGNEKIKCKHKMGTRQSIKTCLSVGETYKQRAPIPSCRNQLHGYLCLKLGNLLALFVAAQSSIFLLSFGFMFLFFPQSDLLLYGIRHPLSLSSIPSDVSMHPKSMWRLV